MIRNTAAPVRPAGAKAIFESGTESTVSVRKYRRRGMVFDGSMLLLAEYTEA